MNTKSSPWKVPKAERKSKVKRKVDFCERCGKTLYRIRKNLCKECQRQEKCKLCDSIVHKAGFCRKHFDENRFLNRDKCTIEGCTDNAQHAGLCKIHYREACVDKADICSIPNCNKKQEKCGLCGAHYQKQRQRRYKLNKCKHEECDNQAFKRGLCFNHWSKANPDIYFIRTLRTRITNSINVKYKKNTNIEILLGCSIDHVRKYIESQFQEGMSWEDRSKWHIDHICPCSQAQNEEELLKLQHYSNLRPLWGKDNLLRKNNRTAEGEEMCKVLLGRDWI